MKKKFLITNLAALSFYSLLALGQSSRPENTLVINADSGKNIISRHIYGQFSEHLGHCIYGGFWVGENSPIPNVRGIRKDVVEALKNIQIPNLRWPGGCFADEYHWKDGIGPRDKRPTMVNTNWGGVTEDNSFGTHEFLDLCQQLGTEPYITGNVGSGTVQEMAEWVEYLNSDGKNPMSDLRKANGREQPWNVKFWGVGNESWGCGGNMRPEFYADQFRRYSTYCRDYNGNSLYKIASGPSSDDYNWTEVMMKNVGTRMNGLSLHYYTVKGWDGSKGSATKFNEDEYFDIIKRCLVIDELITKHSAIMDKYDPAKRVGLIVDEWGTWFDVEPGTNPGFLFQQNTLRDALVAGISLNILNSHCDRVKMANIAQVINVLQSMILTDGPKMCLTPTYHVFDLYKVHQDATLLPLTLQTENYELNGQKIPAITASASKDKEGVIHISLTNADPHRDLTVNCKINGTDFSEISGRILTAPELNAHNTFDKPQTIQPADFKGAKLAHHQVVVKLPAKSIVVLTLK